MSNSITERIPVTGCKERFPIVDKHENRIHVGDKIRYQYCSGPYGQTAIGQTIVTKNHYHYPQIDRANFTFDFNKRILVGFKHHDDIEHAHKTWVEICNI